jgi:hypothetical protein
MEDGSSVVAKIRPRGGLDLEHLIHRDLLPGLGVATPAFLGFASQSAGEGDVLFLEYVGAMEFRSFEAAHQEAAGRWLGRCHGASAQVSIPASVPRRSLEDEQDDLAERGSRLSATLDNPSLGEEGRDLVSRFLNLLQAAIDRWPEWVARTESVPLVLTHGAFVSRNVRMRGSGGELTTVPFDWDHGAVRSPAVDLARTSRQSRGFSANAPLETYRDSLAASGLPLEASTVGMLATLGTVIRSAACSGWLVKSLNTEHVRQPLAELEIYRRNLEAVLSTSG